MTKVPLFRAIIAGAPASGKGTISSRIVKYFRLNHISSGDILRSHMMNNTGLGKEAKVYVENGELVPDNLMMKVILEELKRRSKENWLLDGFPRTKSQAEELCKVEPINAALNLIVPFEVIIKRVQGRWIHPGSGRIYNTDFSPPKIAGKDDLTGEDLIQRSDDKPEAILKRLQVYSSMVDPVLRFYDDLHLLKNFKGKTSDEIWPHVYNYLSTFIEPSRKMV